MIGRIAFTTGTGGQVQAASGDRLHFRWADCRGFGPCDVGRGTRVYFKASKFLGTIVARNVRLEVKPITTTGHENANANRCCC